MTRKLSCKGNFMKNLALVKRDTHLKFFCGVTDFCFTNQQIKADASKK